MPRPDGDDISYYYDIHDRLEEYPKIDMVVYLKTNPEVCYNRMIQRGRESEAGTPQGYIQLISDFHDCMLPHICRDHGIELSEMNWDDFGCPEKVATVVHHSFTSKEKAVA